MNGDPRAARDRALGALLLLWRRERIDAILGILPGHREPAIRERLSEFSGLAPAELAREIRVMREGEFEEAIRKCRSHGGFRLEAAPPALQRWLGARYRERNGREDHQGGTGS